MCIIRIILKLIQANRTSCQGKKVRQNKVPGVGLGAVKVFMGVTSQFFILRGSFMSYSGIKVQPGCILAL